MERKLTAILSADVEGYSRLMGEDEEATIRTLTFYQQVMGALIPLHRGRVVDSPGDNLLAEFGSVVDAVQCAVVIQSTLRTENANLAQNRRMEFRIGLNLGDVMVEGERIYGDGVNIAARVEGLAEAGGICISGTVFDQIKNKVSVTFEDLGPQQVKNIAEPIRAYRAILDQSTASAQPQKKSEAPRRQPPTAVKAVVEDRIEQLGEEIGGVLTWASVAGREFTLSLLEEVTGLAEEKLLDVLDKAVAARVLTPRFSLGQEAYSFVDQPVRDLLYKGIGPARRRRYHLKVGQAIEKVHGRRLEEHYDALADHFIQGNNLQKAVVYATKAGDRASTIYAWELAMSQYQTAVALLEKLGPSPQQQAELLEKVAMAEGKLNARTGESTPLSLAGKETGSLGLNDSLYGRTFVGRERELRQLQGAFDAALSGQGSLAMVIGEPGIGKTSLCEQLATYVTLRDGKALVGHCYEEGSLSLPYLPFVEAMRSYVLTREPDDLRRDLGSGAADVARLVSEIRDRLQVEVRRPGDPEDDRWRLLQAVSGFLRNVSMVQPLLVVLEDLHDADRGTLDLLLHVSRNLQETRLLIVGTYRDVEVDRAHPLSSALAELRRAGSFQRVPLRGLTVDEVQRMMSIVRGQEVPWSRAEVIHRQTEGNPLFVHEVLRYLVEEGIVVREGGRYLLADSEAGIPEGLRDVVGKRLSRLSEKANQVLSVAAVIGREFRLDVLQQVAGLPEEELYGALEEANERAVVEQRHAVGNVGFRFTHAFFRQTLYEETFVPRRIRLHQQVGKTLEEIYSRRLDEHAAELAEHFIQSTEPGDLEKALRYSELAAKRAMQVFAYGEAVRHLQQALRTQEVLDPDDKAKRCDLLLCQAEAMLPQEEPYRVADTVAAEAFALAEEREDSPRAARAAVQACDALMRKGYSGTGTAPAASPEFQEWAARADRHAPSGSIERIYSDLYLGLATMQTGGPAAGHVHYRRAANLALKLDDSAAFFAAASWAVARLNALRDYELRGRVAAEALRRPREGARARDLSIVLSHSALTVFNRGDRPAAEKAWGELRQLAERTRDVNAELGALGDTAVLAFADGRLEETRSLHDSISARAEALGVEMTGLGGGVLVLLDARARYFLGESVEPMLATVSGPGRVTQARRAVILSWLGRGAEMRAIRERFGDVGADTDESAIFNLVNLLEASLGVGDAETAGALMRRLAPLAGYLSLRTGGVSIGRLAGEAAALLGQPEAAHGYYAQALEVCERVRFRPEIALTRFDLAELLLQGTPEEKAQAREHLEFAIGEFREMKMKPALERALGHKQVLKA